MYIFFTDKMAEFFHDFIRLEDNSSYFKGYELG